MYSERRCVIINNKTYRVVHLGEGVWSIEMEMVRAFVVAGETSALLIDTGAGGINLRAAVCECTSLPIRVVNTHSHFDHISGNASFEMLFAHPMELSSLAKAGFQAHPVYDGSGFDLGSRILQVVGLPGHTPGGIALWDAEMGLLFAGDTIASNRPVFLCMDGASVEAFIRSMDRILSLQHDESGGTLRRIFCAHGDVETTVDTVHKLKTCAELVLKGAIEKSPLPENHRSFLSDSAGICHYEDVSLLIG